MKKKREEEEKTNERQNLPKEKNENIKNGREKRMNA